jgi:hypothetical protein
MSQAQAAAGMERLPWLADDPQPPNPRPPKRRASAREAAGWGVAATLLIAGAAYWMGARSGDRQQAPQTGTSSVSVPAARLSAAAPEQPQPQVVLEPAPEVSPAPVRELPIERLRVERRTVERPPAAPARRAPAPAADETAPAASPAKTAAKPAVNPDSKPLTVWPAWRSQGADGRIVRIGAFGTRQQAKLGWRFMVRAYPAVAHLKATVVADRNSRGRRFYRFQIGTTSQAHSEVLCQRMNRIHLSCAVVGLPWDPEGVER